MTNWGATLGLIMGVVMTTLRTVHAWRAGWDVPDTFQSCFTGWSLEKEDWSARRMLFTIPVVVGGAATFIAVKTGFNRWTPKKANL